MPAQIGFISSLQGTAVATKSSGEEITLAVNNPVFEGDHISVSGDDAEAVITTVQDQTIKVPANTTTILEQSTSKSAIEQVEQLQAEILNNEDFDFSQLEATAAGPLEQTGFATTPIIELSENVIEYHSSVNSFNNDSPNFTDADNATDTVSQNDESGLLNTAPSIIGETFANVTEDFQTSVQGNINTAALFSTNTHATTYGQISYNEQGEWQYELNNQLSEVQALGAGDILTESIEIPAQNGASFFVELTINGSNDRAIISGGIRENVTEDLAGDSSNQTVEVSGNLNIEDIDSGEARFIAESEIETTYGTAEINALGEWHYVLNNELSAIQGLTSDSQLTDYFSVRSFDGANQTIQITIQGSDDSPLLNGSNRVELNLASNDTVNGQLGINDPDFGQSHFQAESNISGNFGFGSIEENGSWSYHVDTTHPEINELDADALIHDSFIVTTADGTEQTIIIPISNAPEIIDTASISSSESNDSLPIIELNSDDELLTFNTSLASDESADIYIWDSGSNGTSIGSNTDNISQFTFGSGGDILQLNDLLLEAHSENELDQFLHFTFDGQDSTIEISTDGQASSNHSLVVNNVDLTSFGNSDGEIIQQLIQHGNLDVVGL